MFIRVTEVTSDEERAVLLPLSDVKVMKEYNDAIRGTATLIIMKDATAYSIVETIDQLEHITQAALDY